MGEERPKLTKQQEDDARGAFALFDKKDIGVISIKDLGQAFRTCAMTTNSEQLSEWLDDMDVENTVNADQFVILYGLQKRKDEDEKEMKEAFRVLDKEKKGEIPVEDLKWIMKALGDDLTEDEIDAMVAEIDTDGSGTVDYDAYFSMSTKFP